MKIAKVIARQLVIPTMMGVGIDRLIRATSGRRLLNVMYHGVVRKDSTWFSPRHLTAELFDEQLTYIKRNFDVVSLEEAFRMRNERRVPNRHAITLSFDDGYLNNLETALPIIERHQVPVTLFALGSCAEEGADRVLWPDLISALGTGTPGQEISALGRKYLALRNVQGGAHLIDDLKNAAPNDRDDALDELSRTYGLREKLDGIDAEVWKLMGPTELKRFADSPWIEIGAHGYAHYNLGVVPIEEATNDLMKARASLSALLEEPIESIAYPDGSYSGKVKDVCERLGFKRQLAVDLTEHDDREDRRVQPRHGVPSTTTTASAMFFLNRAFRTKGVL